MILEGVPRAGSTPSCLPGTRLEKAGLELPLSLFGCCRYEPGQYYKPHPDFFQDQVWHATLVLLEVLSSIVMAV